MKGPRPIQELFDEVRDLIESRGISYAVMGGIAVSAWSMPRYTHDVDIALGIGAADVLPLLLAMDGAGYIVPDQFRHGWTDRLAGTRKLTVSKFIDGHVWDVDLFLEESEFLKSVIARRKFVDLDGRVTPLVTPEDLVLFKVLAGRPKDLGDLDGLLLVVGPLDDAYLVLWSQRLGIENQLRETWRRNGRELRS